MLAAITLVEMPTERCCAAARNGIEYLDLWIDQGLSIPI
jgi:hypothetical protein